MQFQGASTDYKDRNLYTQDKAHSLNLPCLIGILKIFYSMGSVILRYNLVPCLSSTLSFIISNLLSSHLLQLCIPCNDPPPIPLNTGFLHYSFKICLDCCYLLCFGSSPGTHLGKGLCSPHTPLVILSTISYCAFSSVL